jgi:hypothetical protein
MRVLVCGGRDFVDMGFVNRILDNTEDITVLIAGGAHGADSLAAAWALKNEIPHVIIPAKWSSEGKAAGAIRNRKMIKLLPDLVVAFPGGSGTKDMIRVARENNVPVKEVSYEHGVVG